MLAVGRFEGCEGRDGGCEWVEFEDPGWGF